MISSLAPTLMKAYLFPRYDTPLQVGQRMQLLEEEMCLDSARTAQVGAEEVCLCIGGY